MAKPRAPRWLTEVFRDGVDERELITAFDEPRYYGCWLAQFDPEERPCTDELERMHVISRQRVENALGALLRTPSEHWEEGTDMEYPATFILLAAWDPRNGKIACEGHHRRYDSHATPALTVPADAYPEHVLEFAEDWGLEHCLPEYAIREEAA